MNRKPRQLAMVVCMLLFAFMAMGSASSKSKSGETKKIVSVEADGEGSDTKSHSNADDSAQNTDKKKSADVSIEEQVLLDHDGITITAKEYVTDKIWGDGIKLLLENNSDKSVTIGCDALIVNNYMITDLFVSTVAAGKKDNEVMYLSSDELEAAGIDCVGQVEIYFHIYEEDSLLDMYHSDCVTIKTSEYDNMDTTPNDAGKELYNENGVRIVGKTVDEGSFWGTAILLYCENTSGRKIGINVAELSVNGFMVDPLFSTEIYDGKRVLDHITILSSDLEENGIETIEEVELKFHIYDADTYDTIADSDKIPFGAQ